MHRKRLEGKIALVKGAAQGIGAAITSAFIQAGALVILSDIQDEKGKELADVLGSQAIYMHLDVRKEEEWKHVMQHILHRFSKLDILVNNAGITGFLEGLGPQDPEHASLESWRAVHATNSEGVFLGCKHALSLMKNNPGSSIINISSRSGIVGIPGAAAYASSKASVRNHTKTVALHCTQQGYLVRCNSIHPAAILTPMWDAMLGSEKEAAIALIAKDIPMQKMGDPMDVAHAAVFLASEEAKYITGIELTIDGGLLAGAGAPVAAKDSK